jgi:hypothetical protein
MSTTEVYRQVALKSIQDYGSLDVMCYAWQTAHLDTCYASWIPRWDLTYWHKNTSILPFLYNATQGALPKLKSAVNENALILQGFSFGTITDIGSVLRFGATGIGATNFDDRDSVYENLMTMSRILTVDRWQNESVRRDEAVGRAGINLQQHFADFSAYLLPLLEAEQRDCHITIEWIVCDLCKEHIARPRRTESTLPEIYHCFVCDNDDFDICSSCYESGGRCKDLGHSLDNRKPMCFWCPYTDEIVSRLTESAIGGDASRFINNSIGACCHNMFLRTSEGWRGVGSARIRADDTLAVLFGSPVPLILRQHGTYYRLAGNCYIHGLMDGEAIEMWENGEIEATDFEIR